MILRRHSFCYLCQWNVFNNLNLKHVDSVNVAFNPQEESKLKEMWSATKYSTNININSYHARLKRFWWSVIIIVIRRRRHIRRPDDKIFQASERQRIVFNLKRFNFALRGFVKNLKLPLLRLCFIRLLTRVRSTWADQWWPDHCWSIWTCPASCSGHSPPRCPGTGSTSSCQHWRSSYTCPQRSRTCTGFPEQTSHLEYNLEYNLEWNLEYHLEYYLSRILSRISSSTFDIVPTHHKHHWIHPLHPHNLSGSHIDPSSWSSSACLPTWHNIDSDSLFDCCWDVSLTLDTGAQCVHYICEIQTVETPDSWSAEKRIIVEINQLI